MTIRAMVHDSLMEVFAGAPVQGRVYQMGALGTGDIPARPDFPYLMHREMDVSPSLGVQDTSRAADIPYQIYAYDERGSAVRVKELLIIARERLLLLPGSSHPSGSYCFGVRWTGFSQDFGNEEYAATVKFASFAITASE